CPGFHQSIVHASSLLYDIDKDGVREIALATCNEVKNTSGVEEKTNHTSGVEEKANHKSGMGEKANHTSSLEDKSSHTSGVEEIANHTSGVEEIKGKESEMHPIPEPLKIIENIASDEHVRTSQNESDATNTQNTFCIIRNKLFILGKDPVFKWNYKVTKYVLEKNLTLHHHHFPLSFQP
ncbi:hypothetical protein Tco_0927635, partial [Tanacetum coccineum]